MVTTRHLWLVQIEMCYNVKYILDFEGWWGKKKYLINIILYWLHIGYDGLIVHIIYIVFIYFLVTF